MPATVFIGDIAEDTRRDDIEDFLEKSKYARGEFFSWIKDLNAKTNPNFQIMSTIGSVYNTLQSDAKTRNLFCAIIRNFFFKKSTTLIL